LNARRDPQLPPLRELGTDLLRLALWERTLTLTLPFFWCAAYFEFAIEGLWPFAVFALVALSFVTYGSTSHDLVHRNLGLPEWANNLFLCVVELLALRSGHAYQAAHLHHHARFPHPDDVEGRAAGRSCARALAEGLAFNCRILMWAMRHAPNTRTWVLTEGVLCVLLAGTAIALVPVTPIFAIYVALMVMGSWVIPLATSYVPHDPSGERVLTQTRPFRGVLARLIGFGHLYHLEHHLYPAIPHRNWSRLAKRLDPYFARTGVKPLRFWF
jgi:beta-carotene hydroxylase